MRFTITPLGSSGTSTVDQAVGRIVRYLSAVSDGNPPVAGGVDPSSGPSRYYADRGAEPGRWLGRGAAVDGLIGAVDHGDFARVLAGRDPRTGVRLISAQGSAGRKDRLGVGNETRRDHHGEAVYDERDVAAALGVSGKEAAGLLDAGERLATIGLLHFLSGTSRSSVPEQPVSYLLPVVGEDGDRWVTENELLRFEAARAAGLSPDSLARAGDPGDQFTLAEAAGVTGVTTRYLRSLCRRYEQHRDEIEATLTDGQEPRRDYVIAYRGVKSSWRILRRDLVAFLHRRTPPAVRVGYDLTLTTEKSLGVLALLGGDAVRAEVLDAIRAGNDAGLAYLERHAGARVKGERVTVSGWTVASFCHLTSRALDPFPHHHNVIANSVVDRDGGRRALDARNLYQHAPAASSLATAEMRHRLSARLGVRWRERPDGGWEVDGVPEEVLREFSRRRTEIDDALRELEAAVGRGSTLDELQAAVLATRPDKRDAAPEELHDEWWQRARGLGFTPRRLAACVHTEAQEVPEPDLQPVFELLAGPDGLCAHSSVFTRGDVVAALVNASVTTEGTKYQPLLVTAARLEQLADEFLASPLAIELLPAEGSRQGPPGFFAGERLFSTTEMLTTQHRILAHHRNGLHRNAAVTPTRVVAPALAAHPELSTEQRELVTSFVTSGHRLQCAVGRAGAGKTTAMRAAVEAWQKAGYRVLGAAVKGEAARQLGVAADLPTETLAWYLSRRHPADTLLDARTVLIVDEASTVPDRDLAKLLELASNAGAAVRLIGDPAQHGAVGAGGMFRVLCERQPSLTPELRQSHRVHHQGDRAAADALRDGRVEEAFDLLHAAGHLHVVDSEVELHLDMLRRWWDHRQAGLGHPMVDRQNSTRRTLNRLAHRLLQAAGEVDEQEVLAAGERAFSAGDRVVARRANRRLHVTGDPGAYVRNGALGTVLRAEPRRHRQADVLVVSFDEIGTIAVPRTFFDEHRQVGGRLDVGLDHAYAVTSYAIQGATYGASTSRLDDGANRAEAYVDITRGRSANHLYLTRGHDPLDGEALPKAPPPPTEDAVAGRLQRSRTEVTAIEIDPQALERRRAGRVIGL